MSSIFANETVRPISVKVILIGNIGVGKTRYASHCSLQYPAKEIPVPTLSPICVRYTAQIESKSCNFEICDTAGEESYASITHKFMRNANIALLMYDITRRETFENIPFWMRQYQQVAEPILAVLIGNKVDRVLKDPAVREVDKDEGERFAEEHGMIFIETSAKDRNLVQSTFKHILKKFESVVQAGGGLESVCPRIAHQHADLVDPEARTRRWGCCPF